MPQQPPQLTKATLTALPNGPTLTVHFNPASLVYSVDNSVAKQSGPPNKAQYVAQFSGKLSMDLQFDTTDTGSDVRSVTNQVAKLMQATGKAQAAAANAAPPSANDAPQSAPAKAPPVLKFAWGSYTFQGIMDSFKETIDFFSADGIALRALVSIALSQQDLVFDDSQNASTPSTAGSRVPSASGDSALSLATRGGDPGAARQLAADNGLDSLRFTGGATLQVNAGVQLNGPAAFVTAPAASASAALGVGLSAGMQIGGGAQLGVGAQIGGGVQLGGGTQIGGSVQIGGAVQAGMGATFGASASAGVPATAGAFAGLQSGRAKASTTTNLNPLQMLPSTVGSDVATFGGASFGLGGGARSSGSAGLSTDVGARFNFSDRLIFKSDD
jgi:hypothetical protein